MECKYSRRCILEETILCDYFYVFCKQYKAYQTKERNQRKLKEQILEKRRLEGKL
jgi:hypothetical protein